MNVFCVVCLEAVLPYPYKNISTKFWALTQISADQIPCFLFKLTVSGYEFNQMKIRPTFLGIQGNLRTMIFQINKGKNDKDINKQINKDNTIIIPSLLLLLLSLRNICCLFF